MEFLAITSRDYLKRIKGVLNPRNVDRLNEFLCVLSIV